jgi:hypothetical protein
VGARGRGRDGESVIGRKISLKMCGRRGMNGDRDRDRGRDR